MMEIELSLGKYIRQLRERKQISMLELSNRTKVAYSHLSRIENESTIPNPDTIVKLSEALDGDLTVMLQKANNLPRIILERLLERDRTIHVQTLRRSIPGGTMATRDSDEIEFGASVDAAKLSGSEIQEIRQAMGALLRLRPHARRAILELMRILHDDEGDDGQG
jgi:transcriptional regulator with XRE-family HTH domain